MPKVSVIIPVFNASRFLYQCLDSIIHQTLADIEIILVNDGSTDDSNKILNDYALMDTRVSIINQKNRGAGAARNAGLHQASGKYLSFLDADDFFKLEMLEELYNRCEETGADIVIYKASAYDNQKGEITGDLGWTTLEGIPDKPLFSYRDVERFFQSCSSVVWDKFFRKSFIDECGIFFQEIRFCNDVYFVHALLCLTEKITVLDKYFVTYRQNIAESISATSKKEPLCFYQSIKATQDKIKTYNYQILEKSYCNWAVGFCLFHLFHRKNLDQKTFAITYGALKDYIFAEMGVVDLNEDFFYNTFYYEQIQKIISTHLEDFYFEAVLDRNNLNTSNYNLQRELNYFKGKHSYLQKEYEKLQHDRQALLNSRSFRLGRMLTWLPRKVRSKIGLK